MPHSLKVTGTAGEALVIGFQSRQQAEDWRKVWRCCSLAELCVGRREGWAGRKTGMQPCWGAPEAAGDDPVCPQVLSHLGSIWNPVRQGSGSPGLQRSPSPSAGDRRGQQRCPERAGSHQHPGITFLEARQGEPLVLPPGNPGTGKGLPGVSRERPEFPALLSPLGDAGEGCIAVGWGSSRGLRTRWGRGSLDLHS